MEAQSAEGEGGDEEEMAAKYKLGILWLRAREWRRMED